MEIPARRFLFLLSSSRRLGNSEQLAYNAAHGLPAEVAQRWMHLLDYPLPHFVDLRHTGSFALPEGNAKALYDATLLATDIVLVAPLYWYNMPAQAKTYLDYWSAWLRIPRLRFQELMQGKTLWLITVSSKGRFEAAPLEASLELTADYMQLHWGGMLHGIGSRPNDIQDDALALQTARSFFRPPTNGLAPKADLALQNQNPQLQP